MATDKITDVPDEPGVDSKETKRHMLFKLAEKLDNSSILHNAFLWKDKNTGGTIFISPNTAGDAYHTRSVVANTWR